VYSVCDGIGRCSPGQTHPTIISIGMKAHIRWNRDQSLMSRIGRSQHQSVEWYHVPTEGFHANHSLFTLFQAETQMSRSQQIIMGGMLRRFHLNPRLLPHLDLPEGGLQIKGMMVGRQRMLTGGQPSYAKFQSGTCFSSHLHPISPKSQSISHECLTGKGLE
jgi:hypothetical protein